MALFRLKGEPVKGFITFPGQDAYVAQYPSNAPALTGDLTGDLTGTGEAISPLPSRGAVAVQVAEFAVILLRGSAVAVLLSPVLLAGLLLAG